MLSYNEFLHLNESFDEGEKYTSKKRAILDKYNKNQEKVGKYILEKDVEFEVIQTLEHDIVLKSGDVFLVLSKKEAASLFKLV